MLDIGRRSLAPAVEPSGRAEHLADRRDIRRDDAVPPPERFRLVEVVDDRDLSKEVVDEAQARRTHAPRHPADSMLVRRRARRRGQVLERQERGRA